MCQSGMWMQHPSPALGLAPPAGLLGLPGHGFGCAGRSPAGWGNQPAFAWPGSVTPPRMASHASQASSPGRIAAHAPPLCSSSLFPLARAAPSPLAQMPPFFARMGPQPQLITPLDEESRQRLALDLQYQPAHARFVLVALQHCEKRLRSAARHLHQFAIWEAMLSWRLGALSNRMQGMLGRVGSELRAAVRLSQSNADTSAVPGMLERLRTVRSAQRVGKAAVALVRVLLRVERRRSSMTVARWKFAALLPREVEVAMLSLRESRCRSKAWRTFCATEEELLARMFLLARQRKYLQNAIVGVGGDRLGGARLLQSAFRSAQARSFAYVFDQILRIPPGERRASASRGMPQAFDEEETTEEDSELHIGRQAQNLRRKINAVSERSTATPTLMGSQGSDRERASSTSYWGTFAPGGAPSAAAPLRSDHLGMSPSRAEQDMKGQTELNMAWVAPSRKTPMAAQQDKSLGSETPSEVPSDPDHFQPPPLSVVAASPNPGNGHRRHEPAVSQPAVIIGTNPRHVFTHQPRLEDDFSDHIASIPSERGGSSIWGTESESGHMDQSHASNSNRSSSAVAPSCMEPGSKTVNVRYPGPEPDPSSVQSLPTEQLTQGPAAPPRHRPSNRCRPRPGKHITAPSPSTTSMEVTGMQNLTASESTESEESSESASETTSPVLAPRHKPQHLSDRE